MVGGGPRSLHACERLATLGLPAASSVTVYEGSGRWGSGRTYPPDAPRAFRLNAPSTDVDPWPTPRDAAEVDLAGWLAARGDVEVFPPRAIVGDFLEHTAARLRARLPALTVVPLTVTHVTPTRGGALVGTSDGHEEFFDEVLLATGHARAHDHQLAAPARTPPTAEPDRTDPDPVILVPSVYPASELERAVGDARRVLVRGAALTGIDAALLLTAHPGVHIRLTSRTGRLMRPKPAPEAHLGAARWAEFSRAAAQAVRRAARRGPGAPLAPVLAHWAALLLHAAGHRSPLDELSPMLAEALERELAGQSLHANGPDELAHALEIAQGRRPPDPAWALGAAWRALQPGLVGAQKADLRRQVDSARRGVGEVAGMVVFADYFPLVAATERLAYGPPLVNATALLALVESGRVSVAAGADAWAAAAEWGAEVVVDAVLAPPGITAARDPVWDGLWAAGYAHRAACGPGALVDHSLALVDPSGHPVPGVSAVGRATEGCIIAHDTLSRRYHHELHAWARRVVRHPGAHPSV